MYALCPCRGYQIWHYHFAPPSKAPCFHCSRCCARPWHAPVVDGAVNRALVHLHQGAQRASHAFVCFHHHPICSLAWGWPASIDCHQSCTPAGQQPSQDPHRASPATIAPPALALFQSHTAIWPFLSPESTRWSCRWHHAAHMVRAAGMAFHAHDMACHVMSCHGMAWHSPARRGAMPA